LYTGWVELKTIELNLATVEYQDKKLAYPVMIATAILALILCFYSVKVYMGYNRHVNEYEERIAQLDQSQVTRKKIEQEGKAPASNEEAGSIRATAEFVNRLILLDVFPWGRLLDEVEALAPKGVILMSFGSGKEENSVKMEGKASSMSQITEFLKALEGSKIFKGTTLSNVSVGKDGGEADKGGGEPAILFEINTTAATAQLFSP